MTLFQNWQAQHLADVDITVLISLHGLPAKELAEIEAQISYEQILEEFHEDD